MEAVLPKEKQRELHFFISPPQKNEEETASSRKSGHGKEKHCFYIALNLPTSSC